MRISEEEATRRMEAMLEEVAAAAGAPLDRVTRTCFGLAGIASPAARAWAHRIVPALVAGDLLLCGDEEIALDAAFAGGPGILVIAGTGSNVVGRAATGALFGAGGWGPVLGDEGSGYWIGLEALRAALRAHDRDQPRSELAGSCLLREIERHWELDSLAELVAFANQRSGLLRPAPDFAALAPIVARCAQPAGDQPGDALAARVLERAGHELAEQVALVARKMSADRAQPIGVAYTGSVLSQIAPVRVAMVARLAVSVPCARVLDTPVDPLEGALWRARQG